VRGDRHGHSALRPPSDQKLEPDELIRCVLAAADGDQASWNRLVEGFSGLLWAICRTQRLSTADSADVIQLTWLRLLERIGSIQDPARLGGWLATTCRRECLAVHRRAARVVPVDDEGYFEGLAADAAPDRPILIAERDAELWAAFEQLGERCQLVLRAEAAEGSPSYQAVAVALGIPAGSLGPTRARCLKHLRQLLDLGGIQDAEADS
jgi:RNA polymerase sigma factor (sigma-70 family)